MRKRRPLDPTFFDALEQRLVLSSRGMFHAIAPAVVTHTHSNSHPTPFNLTRLRSRGPRFGRRFTSVGPAFHPVILSASSMPAMQMSSLAGTVGFGFTTFVGNPTFVGTPIQTIIISPGGGGGGTGTGTGGGGGGGGGGRPTY